MMKISAKFFATIFVSAFLFLPCFSETITGNVAKNETKRQNRVVDSNTQKGIPFATVKIPSKNFQTKTDTLGQADTAAMTNRRFYW